MYTLRYCLTQLDINDVSTYRALKRRGGKTEVCFSEEDAASMSVITKNNSLLFQALEQIKGGEPSRLTHGVSAKFLNDLVVVHWPTGVDAQDFMFEDGDETIKGRELRKHLFLHGFKLGNTQMAPLLAGAGYSRDGKYLFVNRDLRAEVMEKITLGLISGTAGQSGLKLNMGGEFSVNMAKLCAYIGLADSDGQSLDELHEIWKMEHEGQACEGFPDLFDKSAVVVVPDVYGPVGVKSIAKHIIVNDNNHQDPGEVVLRKAKESDDANYSDGYGFICPAWSKLINDLRHCRKPGSFHNRAFIVRAPFVKGALVECDFEKYLKSRGKTKIVDVDQVEHDVQDVRVVLTESMFKGYKYFKNRLGAQEDGKTACGYYMEALKNSGLSMVIVGSDSAPRAERRMNYQFLASLQPDGELYSALIGSDLERHKDMLRLLEGGAAAEDPAAYARQVADHLERSVSLKAQIEDAADEDENENAEEETEYAAMLARMIRRYPKLAITRPVQQQLAEAVIKNSMELSRGRITVQADSRMLIGDPISLLNSLAGENNSGLLQKKGMVFAPGIRDAEILLMRNPHVSVFEAVAAKNLKADGKQNDGRRLYQEYFGRHDGLIFANSAISATLGGADHDGDRVFCCTQENVVNAVKENNRRIYSLLKASTDEEFRIDPEEQTDKLSALPIISIQGFSPKNKLVADINEDFWLCSYETYLQAICSKVGIYSVRVASVLFNRGMTAAAGLGSQEIEAAVHLLKKTARMCTVIGLDIDSVKSGEPPRCPSLGDSGRRCGLLRFSRYVKKNSSSSFKGLDLYKAAYRSAMGAAIEESGDEQEDQAEYEETTKTSVLQAISAGEQLVKDFSLEAYYPLLEKWQPLEHGKRPPADEILFKDVLCKGLNEDEALKEAVKAASVQIRKAEAVRSAAASLRKSVENMQLQRCEILRFLLARYPFSTAAALNEAVLEGCVNADADESVDLKSDPAVIGYAFMKNSERREALKTTIFGDQPDDGFRYDADCIQLAKAAQRLGGAIRSRRETLERLEGEEAAGRPVIYGELQEEIRKIAEEKNVNMWRLGLELLRKGRLAPMNFVLLFYRYSPEIANKRRRREVLKRLRRLPRFRIRRKVAERRKGHV